MIRSDSLKALAPALVKAQKKMGAAIKDAKNPFFKSKFADLNSVIEASVPVLNDEDIAVLQTPIMKDGKQIMQTVLLHSSGEYIASETDVVAAKVNDPQASGSALSYARRYGLQSTVTLRAEDDDSESAMGRGKSQPKQQELQKPPEVKPEPTLNSKPETPSPNVAPNKKISFNRKTVEDDL